VEATCTTEGSVTSTCTCGDVKTETLPITEHSYENGTCEDCGEADPDYTGLEAGLYDANGVMLASWEESGIEVEKDYTSDNCKTETTSGYCVLTNKYPTATKVVTPDSIVKIGERVFSGCTGLTEIKISDNVTSIGLSAFYGCTGLISIKIPANVESLGQWAFSDCTGLTSIKLPEGLSKIDKQVFMRCTGLTSIGGIGSGASVEIPLSVNSIGEDAFYGCTGLTSVDIPSYVTTIEKDAFADSHISNITLAEGVTTLGSNAFTYSDIESIEIPASLTNIGRGAFSGCKNLASITVAEGNPKYDSRDNCNAIIEIATSKLVAGCLNTNIPNSVNTIANSAFECLNITALTIPTSITTIESYAFELCTKLETINYTGTQEQWNAITKKTDWNYYCNAKIAYNCSE